MRALRCIALWAFVLAALRGHAGQDADARKIWMRGFTKIEEAGIEKVDEVTGLSRKIVIESRAADLRPRITIVDPDTGEAVRLPGSGLEARYLLPVGANIVCNEDEAITPGEELAPQLNPTEASA